MICFSGGNEGSKLSSSGMPLSLERRLASSSLSSRIRRALGSSLTTAWVLIRLAESAYLNVERVSS